MIIFCKATLSGAAPDRIREQTQGLESDGLRDLAVKLAGNRRSAHRSPRGRRSRSATRRLPRTAAGSAGRQPRPSAIAMVSTVPVNSHSVEVPSVIRTPARAAKVSGAVIS